MAKASSSEKTKKVDPVAAAWADTIEKVSVAGWKEALDEKLFLTRIAFRTALLVFAAFCISDSYYVIRRWATNAFKDEISDVLYPDSVPFSNVTICTPAYLKLSFVKEHIHISDRLAEGFRQETNESLDELYEQFAIYLSLTARPKPFDNILLRFFQKIARENSLVLDDLSGFAQNGTYQCDEVLRRCWFNGDEFDCCAKAVASFGDDGICYLLHLNSDSDNAFPSNKTFRQTKPGPHGGLIVEASMNLNETVWMDPVAADGCVVFVNAIPYNIFQSPLGVSNRAVTHIKVRPSWRRLAKRCADRGELHKRHPYIYYDPEGFDCSAEALLATTSSYLNCTPPFYLHKPNASTVCSPEAKNLAMTLFTDTQIEATFKKAFVNSSRVGADTALIRDHLAKLETAWQEALDEKNACPKHCTRWTYGSSSSFFDLESSDKDTNRMFSRIHVFYDDLSFRQYDEVLEYPSDLALCDFGNVIGWYWGMSLISFFHLLYYVPRYLFLSRHRRGVERIPWRSNRVGHVVVQNSWV